MQSAALLYQLTKNPDYLEDAQSIAKECNNITLNEKLFARVKEVYDQKETLQLTQEKALKC